MTGNNTRLLSNDSSDAWIRTKFDQNSSRRSRDCVYQKRGISLALIRSGEVPSGLPELHWSPTVPVAGEVLKAADVQRRSAALGGSGRRVPLKTVQAAVSVSRSSSVGAEGSSGLFDTLLILNEMWTAPCLLPEYCPH